MCSTRKSVPIGCRVYASCSQGGRKYMEDTYALNYQTSASNSDDLSFVYMAIFDGHGGDMAANYARDHLLFNIIRQRAFWATDNDNQVLQAISKGFLQTHYDMMKEVGKGLTLFHIFKDIFLALALYYGLISENWAQFLFFSIFYFFDFLFLRFFSFFC